MIFEVSGYMWALPPFTLKLGVAMCFVLTKGMSLKGACVTSGWTL